ncbi:MAG: hypothetical protein K2K59_02240 [Muribaculaceae bacterium]|nr:hypothetical protein [Muribaculaceae bacterium]
MRKFLLSLMLLPGIAGAIEPEQLVAALEGDTVYCGRVDYAVTLPQSSDEIRYLIDLQSVGTDSWLIDWHQIDHDQTGWTARTGGDYYSFRGNRLQEIHAGWDRQQLPRAQFSELLPQNVGAQLREIISEPERYEYKLTEANNQLTLRAMRKAGDITDAELTWTFDSKSMQPQKFSAEYNPGQISEHQVYAHYQPLAPTVTTLSESILKERYAEAFANYRQSNFAIEQMRGEPLPAFSIQLASGEGRLTRQQGESFRQPAVIVLLESESALAGELVSAVRQAIDESPRDAQVIWACMERNPRSASELLGALRPGETALIGAKKLAADCGAAALPVIMICQTDGTVKDIAIGLNKDTRTDVIQMIMKL